MTLERGGCNDLPERRRYARQVIANPTLHYRPEAHPEVRPEWIEQTLVDPYHHDRESDGRDVYYGAVPEIHSWIRVVVEDDRLHTAYLVGRLRKRWGKP
jgi:hypothetical protein